MKANELLYTEIVKRHLGTNLKLADSQVLLSKEDYVVVSITTEQPSHRLILKLAGPNAPLDAPFDRTYAMNQRVRQETSVPTFEAIAYDMSSSVVPYRYLMMTQVEGRLWAEVRHDLHDDDRCGIYRQLGNAVAQLHRIEYIGFGEPGNGDETTRAKVTDYLAALSDRARRRIRNAGHLDLFLALLQANKDVFNSIVTPRLTHEDLHPGNILVRCTHGQWELAGILDFDSAWAGGCESDLARLELWRGMTGPGFFEEYRQVNPISEGYPLRSSFYQLLWCLEYADPSEQHHTDTKLICDRLGIPAITFL
ncbi:phosphotransferase family protein [Paenibacillus gansuensis]|uniref:Phosphotransferase family protein n=1 Tax=Paenibacillus gansuensis TaxID=306542 RepID=A0ABW5P737_9BACL